MKLLTIVQVAHRAGVGVETVRFYEREGLLAEPARKASGYRQYAEDLVARLRQTTAWNDIKGVGWYKHH